MKRFTSFLLLVIFVKILFSQTPYVVVQNYTIANGLPTNLIRCVKADNHGNIWFGSTMGLTKFDGQNFITYTTTNGLPSNTINKISIASNDDILIATSNGISRFNGISFVNNLGGIICKHVIESSNNELWVATSGNGVRRFNGSSWISYTTAEGLPHNFVNVIVEDLNNKIWVGTSEGVARFDNPGWTVFSNLNGNNNESDQVISAACDAVGHLWFGSKPGFGVGGGVSRYDGTQWIHYNTSQGLAGKQVEDIAIDAANGKFFATFNNGASFFEDVSYPTQYIFKTINASGGLISNQLYGVDIAPDGYIWFVTNSGVSKVAPLRYHSTHVIDAKCNTNFTGSIQLTVEALHQNLYISVDSGLTFFQTLIQSGLAPGQYHVFVSDNSYKQYIGEFSVLLVPPINPNLSDTLLLCQGDSLQITITTTGSNYHWSPDEYITSTTISNPLVYPPTSQYYYFEMYDENGCHVEDSVWINVIAKTPMEVHINGNVITIIGNFISYAWYYYNQIIPGAFTNVYVATQPGIYYCYATDANGCTTNSGMIHYNNPMISEHNLEYAIIHYYQGSTLFVQLISDNHIKPYLPIMLYNLEGKIILNAFLHRKSNNIYSGMFNIDLPTAQYILLIENLAKRIYITK